VVRVPLGGRRVRGFVVEVGTDDGSAALRPIAAVSGSLPVFDEPLLATLRWAAHHYVAPLSAMLERAMPPNNPVSGGAPSEGEPVPQGTPVDEVVTASLSGRRIPPTVLLASHPPIEQVIGCATALLVGGRSTIVVLATAGEAEEVHGAIEGAVSGRAVLVHGDMSDREMTTAWGRAGRPCVLIGTPRVAVWRVAAPGLGVIIEDGRRAMKDRQTPTVHARDVLRRRSQQERFPLLVTGPAPTTEILATGPRVARAVPGRLWPLVEVVDRRTHHTGGAVLTDPVRRALASVTRRQGRSFVFGHRKGYSAATRCVACHTVRRCQVCGSRPDPGVACMRCGAELGPCAECGGTRFEPLGAGVGRIVAEVGRVVGREQVGAAPADTAVTVGTERDLVGVRDMDLVVIPDLDGLIHGTNYRAAEDALRLGARLAGIVGRGGGRRMMVQTSEPEHPVVRALVKADPLPALFNELDERSAFGYPPVGELIVIEVTASDLPEIGAVRETCEVLGPARRGESARWLLQGPDLADTRTLLRTLVQKWRDGGAKVRIDVDPIDL
jgi:primosomal protein N' (replication factor Y) (superfamily II helicase)